MSRPTIPTAQASQDITPEFRNDLYSALLSSSGIRNIEASLYQELQESGWLDRLKSYMQYLLREGLVTSHPELMDRVMDKIKASNAGLEIGAGASGSTNGTANGVNGSQKTCLCFSYCGTNFSAVATFLAICLRHYTAQSY